MPSLSRRAWVPESSENYVQSLAKFTATQSAEKIAGEIFQLTALNRKIYEQECFNLNPAGNAMNPRAEAFLAEFERVRRFAGGGGVQAARGAAAGGGRDGAGASAAAGVSVQPAEFGAAKDADRCGKSGECGGMTTSVAQYRIPRLFR